MQLDSPLKPFSQDKTNTSSLWLSAKPMLLPTPALDFADEQTARHSLRDYFLNTFDTYEQLFECLKHEDAFFIKPINLRHPLIFYFGHTATFFVNKLLLSKLITERLNPHFESIFAIGVDEMSWDDLDEVHYDWPTVQAVRDYRHQVRALILNIIEHAPLNLPLNWHNPWWTLIMGIEHERIHLETSSVLIRQHALEHVHQHPQWRANIITGIAPENSLIAVPEGQIHLQKDFNHPFYGWDNEYGQHEAEVAAFEAAKYLVSNQEFLAFVEADGYQTGHYWSEEGLGWLQFSQATHPCFWCKTELGWSLRLMLEEVPMPWDWPVEVNYHEAKAFCQWKSQQLEKTIRLPTEDEWYRLYAVSDLDPDLPSPEQANIELKYGTSSCPVDHFQQGDFYDIQGNVWQWTETPIYPFHGFQVHPLYDDFSPPTFDGRHNIIKGGSWISAGNEACTVHVMLLDGISFNTLASAMSPLIKPCNSFLHSMKVTSWCLNIWSFSTAPNTLASPILPKHWCSWRSRISGKLHVKVLWILAVLLAAPALNWHTILIRSPVWIFLHALFSKPSFWPKVTESVISSP